MTDDPHHRFVTWLLAGAEGDPARDLALHASVCPECLRRIAAHDALTAIDVGRAPLPPWKPAARQPLGLLRVAGIVAVTASLVVLGWSIAFGVSQLARGGGEKSGQVLSATGRPDSSATRLSGSPQPTITQPASAP